MPKTLVLFHGNSDAIAATADAVAEGVRSVRFAEVDVRQLAPAGEPGTQRHRALSSADELAGYDALVLGAAGDAEIPRDIEQFLGEAAALRQRGGLGTSVGASFVAEATGAANDDARWMLLRALGALQLVLVPGTGEGAEPAKALGHRVAHVVSWITHARSHHHH